MARRRPDPTTSFYRYTPVGQYESCWLWMGARSSGGYGHFGSNGKTIQAHRFSYYLHYGPFDKRLLVCHKCDVKSCVNPHHLFLGTQLDNLQDAAGKGRIASGERSWGAKLDWKKVRKIRSIYVGGQCSLHQLGQMYNVHHTLIWGIVHGKYWKERVDIHEAP